MGIFTGTKGGRDLADGGNPAFSRRLQNEIQIMETDFKKLSKELEDARRLKAQFAKELSLLTTRMRENEKVVGIKDRSYSLLEEELKRKKKELQNQPNPRH